MRIVGLIGRSGAGKNTVAGILAAKLADQGFAIRIDAFGLPIKRHVRSEYGTVDKIEHREMMQQLGGFMRGWRRSYFEDEFMRRNGLFPCNCTEVMPTEGEAPDFLIAPDVRYVGEEVVCRRHGVVWLVQGAGKLDGCVGDAHDSERYAKEYSPLDADAVIAPQKSLAKLVEVVTALVDSGAHLPREETHG